MGSAFSLEEGDFGEERPSHVELILTGWDMPHSLLEAADPVTEMVAVKQPYNRGIPAHKGITRK